jgi:hypothetical protein
MAKKKTVKKSVRLLPNRPPADLSEAVLMGAASEVSPEMIAAYVAYMYPREVPTEKQKTEACKAVLTLANVGFAFWNWQNGRQ